MEILYFDDYQTQAEALAGQLDARCQAITRHRFPDGEVRVGMPALQDDHVVICRSLDHPNDKLIELLLASQTLRQMGVQRLTLVAPYLGYMRQDTAFHAGEAVSQRIIGQFLADQFDDLITVDPHLHRITLLADAVPCQHSLALSAAPLLADFLARRGRPSLLLGPDSESEQWVSAIARRAGIDWAIAEKQRLGDRDVIITLPACQWQDRDIIVIDDVASTGKTLAETAKQLLAHGAQRLHALLTHALFADNAAATLSEVGYCQLWSTDSISHPSNCIALAPLLADALRSLADNG